MSGILKISLFLHNLKRATMTQFSQFLQPIQYLFVIFSLAPVEAYGFPHPISRTKQILANIHFGILCLLLTSITVFLIFYFHYLNLPQDLSYDIIFQMNVSAASIIYLAIVIESKIGAKQHLKILQKFHEIDRALVEFDQAIDYVAVSSRYTFQVYSQLGCSCFTWTIGVCSFYKDNSSLHFCCLASIIGCLSVPTMTRLSQCSFYLDLIEYRIQCVCKIISKTFINDQAQWDQERLLKIHKLYNLIWEAWHGLNLLMTPSLIIIIVRVTIGTVVDGYIMYLVLIYEFSNVAAVGEIEILK